MANARRRPWPRRRQAAALCCLLLMFGSLGGARAFYENSGIQVGPDEYNIPAWELRNLPSKWLFAFGQLFRHRPSVEEQDADLKRFFQLTREIDALEQQQGDASSRGASSEADLASLGAKRKQRDGLENSVEATLESRLTDAIKQAGVTRDLGPLGHVVWPPVDFEFTRSPRTLAISPRDHIELKESRLLREGLTLEAVEKIENDTARREDASTLAFLTGGIGAYPTIVDYAGSYREALEAAAHEWTHNYLSFRPLGFNYYENAALRSINETVAGLVGQELADIVVNRWPLQPAAPDAPVALPERPQAAQGRVDVGAELRKLRGEVDELLAAGQVDAAEALMEQRRQELVAGGVFIRKINQAYFAFTNLYAGATGSPGATNPIGPKVDELRRRSGSLSVFVRIVGGVTSVAKLDRALAALQ